MYAPEITNSYSYFCVLSVVGFAFCVLRSLSTEGSFSLWRLRRVSYVVGTIKPPFFSFFWQDLVPVAYVPFVWICLFGVNLVMNIHENQNTMTQETSPILFQSHHTYFPVSASLRYHPVRCHPGTGDFFSSIRKRVWIYDGGEHGISLADRSDDA